MNRHIIGYLAVAAAIGIVAAAGCRRQSESDSSEAVRDTGEAVKDFTGRVIERTGEGMEKAGESLEQTGADMQTESDTTIEE